MTPVDDLKTPGYLSLIDRDFDRANEKAWMIGAAYDFSTLLTRGLSGDVKFAWGRDAINPATRAAAPNQAEYDVTVDYRPPVFKPTFLRGLWFRTRGDILDQQGAKKLGGQIRLILNWERNLFCAWPPPRPVWPRQSYEDRAGRLIPSFCIRERSVLGWRPSSSAALPLPWILQAQASTTRRICARSRSSRRSEGGWAKSRRARAAITLSALPLRKTYYKVRNYLIERS